LRGFTRHSQVGFWVDFLKVLLKDIDIIDILNCCKKEDPSRSLFFNFYLMGMIIESRIDLCLIKLIHRLRNPFFERRLNCQRSFFDCFLDHCFFGF